MSSPGDAQPEGIQPDGMQPEGMQSEAPGTQSVSATDQELQKPVDYQMANHPVPIGESRPVMFDPFN